MNDKESWAMRVDISRERDTLASEVAALKARVQELEKDKARLDWLQSNYTRFVSHAFYKPPTNTIRIALDNAIKEHK